MGVSFVQLQMFEVFIIKSSETMNKALSPVFTWQYCEVSHNFYRVQWNHTDINMYKKDTEVALEWERGAKAWLPGEPNRNFEG